MKIILLLIFTLCVPHLLANEIKATSTTNKSAIFPADVGLKKNSLIYVYKWKENKNLTLSSVMRVKDCNSKVCKASIVKSKPGASLSLNHYFSTKVIISKNKKHHLFTSVGGPMTMGYNLGYFYSLNRHFRVGAKAGLLDAEIGDVEIDGNYFSLQTEYRAWKIKTIEINPYAEFGYINANLDFAEVNGPVFSESSPYVGLGLDFWKSWERLFMLGKLGYSRNFFKSDYTKSAVIYTGTFDGGLFTIEIGLGLNF